jgi:Putative transposase
MPGEGLVPRFAPPKPRPADVPTEHLQLVAKGPRFPGPWRACRSPHCVKVMDLEVNEFLRRFLLHGVPDGFVRNRYFGLLANRRRGWRSRTVEPCWRSQCRPSGRPSRRGRSGRDSPGSTSSAARSVSSASYARSRSCGPLRSSGTPRDVDRHLKVRNSRPAGRE